MVGVLAIPTRRARAPKVVGAPWVLGTRQVAAGIELIDNHWIDGTLDE